MINEIIKRKIEPIFESMGILQADVPIILERPKNEDHGDIAITVAFLLSKIWKESPKMIAIRLVEALNKDELCSELGEFIAINGFINIRFSDLYIMRLLGNLNKNFSPHYPSSDHPILLEYVSANPTGPLHIGHGRWAVIGSTLAKLLLYTNHDVVTEFYVNDAGNQIKKLHESVNAVKESKPIPENGYKGDYIYKIAKMDVDPVIYNLDEQKSVLKRLDVSFDNWFYESSLSQEYLSNLLKEFRFSDYTY